ncbi:hypothetical protein H6P81_018040 [Aristolochia fimbriata]|uniref:Aminotransferase-like plant mobile domain-containing protein n=1 Tax=Aristolochia fimbriata TaxID=158543 RepID=A0AAV7E316_ARIFI|nr:hypothetical protein H6P81_018040 [Aristolochia fimbriata]
MEMCESENMWLKTIMKCKSWKKHVPEPKRSWIEDLSPSGGPLHTMGICHLGSSRQIPLEREFSIEAALSLPVQALASAIFYRMNAWFVHRRRKKLLRLQRIFVLDEATFTVVMADTPLLYDQDSHRSESIWHGEDRGCLECTEHFQTLRHWPMDERMLPYVEAAGFGALHRVQWLRLDKPLITALVERWRSETNTFHLANGEMTITLEDVAVLLGLRVDGDAVSGSTRGDWMELARVLLGVELPPGSFQGGRLSLSWLRGRFSFCPDDATELVIQQHARAYLLHLVGATIFSDGSARGVHMAYLTLFEDFEEAGRYSWGAATLAFLYRELAKACRTGVVGIAGCLTLMQVERPTDECHQSWWKPGAIQDRVGPPTELSGKLLFEQTVTPPEDVEHVTRISRKGRAGEDWTLYHRDYIARWEARAEYVITSSRAHTPRHAPSAYMRWYLGVTR